MQKSKSPIKNPPLHVPGQSLDKRIRDLSQDFISEELPIAAMLCAFAAMEWYRFYAKIPPMPRLYTFMALIGVVWAYFKMSKRSREIKDLKLGLTGERAVGQHLSETLSPLKYQVFHDIPGQGFNIDHVIIGPTGIFSIETKTRSKPSEGEPHIQYDGQTIKVNGALPDRDAVKQAKAEASWLSEILEQSTGKKFPVQPIVIFPGWFISPGPAHAEVWVLNEKAAPAFIQNGRNTLRPEDISLVTFHLKRYVISTDENKR